METEKSCKIHYINRLNYVNVPLSSSKSESNRVLILNALSNPPAKIQNLSNARDTQTMNRLLSSHDDVLDVLDAGTTMRFLIAYHAISDRDVVLTGTERMQQRPVKVLAEALQQLGANIEYENEEGYPPIRLKPFAGQATNKLAVRGDISSQYISALLMIAPGLPEGLTIELTGKVMSKPYIEMTLALMELYGIAYEWDDNRISIPSQTYKAKSYTVESDWSGASYWYSMVALAERAEIKLLGLRENSLQGDNNIVNIMDQLGVKSIYEADGVLLKKKGHVGELFIDFSHCPDLAQTVAVTCAAKGIVCRMVGLQSLRIKETDRIAALQNELAKIGASFEENENSEWVLTPDENFAIPADLTIHTYEDHRMAMAFAPLATKGDVIIEDPRAADKSYPTIWEHMQLAGFNVEMKN